MNKNLLGRIAYFFRQDKRRKRWLNTVVFMSAVVVFVVTYMLILPAITLEKEMICGLEEHTHTDDCYEEVKTLVCGLEEGEEHEHTDDCYETELVLICGLPEHEHTDDCCESEEEEALSENLGEEEALEIETETETETGTFEETAVLDDRSEELIEDTPVYRNVGGGSSGGSSGNEIEITDLITAEKADIGEPLLFDEVISGGGLLADDTLSGGAMEAVITEGMSEAYVEAYTEVTTELLMTYTDVMFATGTISGTYEGINWSLAPGAGGGYTLNVSAGTSTEEGAVNSTEIPSDFWDNPDISVYRTLIDKLVISNDITNIKASAFSGCTSLRSVEFGTNSLLERIEEGAFSGCEKLMSINLESCAGLKYLGCSGNLDTAAFTSKELGVFYGTALTSVTIPSAVTQIGSYAFYNCASLESVNVEAHTEAASFGVYIFGNCKKLKSINLENFAAEGNHFYSETQFYDENNDAYYVSGVGGNGMFYNCTALTELVLPPVSANSDLSYLCKGCSALTSLSFEKATALTGSGGQLNNIVDGCSALKTMDLSPLTSMTTLYKYVVMGGVETVILPCSLSTIESRVFENTSVAEIIFKKNEDGSSSLVTTKDSSFSGTTKLREIELVFSNTGNTIFAQWVLNGCSSLEKVTLSCNGVLSDFGYSDGWAGSCFQNCNNLKEFVYDIGSLKSISNVAFNKMTNGVKLTVGANVDEINTKFLAGIGSHISSYEFAPNNTFTVTTTSGYDIATAETILKYEGTYCTDSKGNLYFITSEATESAAGAAKLIYASRSGSGTFTVPDTITYTDTDGTKKSATVRFVEEGAFEGCHYDAINFEAIANINALGNRAFAGCYNLKSINDKTTDSEIKALFTGTSGSFGADLFTSTKIETKAFETGDSATSTSQSELGLSISGSSSLDAFKDKVGCYATEESATINANLSDKNSGNVYRVYFKCSDGCDYKDKFYDQNNKEITVNQCYDNGELVEGVYYYELPVPASGSTTTTPFTFSYPNGSYPGNKVQVWSVMGTAESFAALGSQAVEPAKTITVTTGTDEEGNEVTATVSASENYIELVWDTLAESFNVQKTAGSNTPVFRMGSGSDKTIYVEGVSFIVSLDRTTARTQTDYGRDHVSTAVFEDVLKLPTGLSWINALNVANFSSIKSYSVINTSGGSGSLYATVNEEDILVCTIELTAERLKELKLGTYTDETTGEKSLSIIYTVENGDIKSEISSAEATITFGPQVITAKSANEGETFEDIVNTVYSKLNYEYAGSTESEATAKLQVSPGQSELKYGKELVKTANYLGEDVVYKITVDNETAMTYNGAISLYDDLSSQSENVLYVTAKNIEKMFKGAAYDPDYLTVKITNAVIVNRPEAKIVYAVDGETPGTLSAENTARAGSLVYNGLYEGTDNDVIATNGEIIISLNADKNISVQLSYGTGDSAVRRTVTVGEGGDYPSISAAFKDFGYIVTKKDCYLVCWDIPDNSYEPNYHKEYELTATVKNSFQYLTIDDEAYYNSYNYDSYITAINRLYTSKADYEGSKNAISPDASKAYFDIVLSKTAAYNGVELKEGFSIDGDGGVLDYTLKTEHRGEGTYDILPLVDHMTGPQAILAPVEGNDAGLANTAASTKYVDADGTEYYVLNGGDGLAEGESYTYNDVWLGASGNAASVTVTRSDAGLDTIIKWYYMNTYNSNWTIETRYKAIKSQTYAGNENTVASYNLSNETWLNDRPTHRLWRTIVGGGTAIKFEKNIVTTQGETPATDVLDSDDKSAISFTDNKVLYRLEFSSNGKESINGKSICDKLPETGTTGFKWALGEGGNVKIWSTVSDEINAEIVNPTSYSIVNYNPMDDVVTTTEYQQYIKWGDDFEINFGENGGAAYIYVELQFPQDDATWNAYAEAYGATTLTNTLYVYGSPSTVMHNLMAKGKVLLKKGVYETGYFLRSPSYKGTHYAHFVGTDRVHYNITSENNNERANVVHYYILLSNSGPTRLYLSPIYDIMPKGFEYFAMFNTTDDSTNCGPGSLWTSLGAEQYSVSNRSSEIPALCDIGWKQPEAVVMPEGSTKEKLLGWHSRIVKSGETELSDGRTRLKFDIKTYHGEDKTIRTDYEFDERPYLEPGEALQFGITCYTGSEQLDPATNYCAMEFFDEGRTGVEADTETKADVSTANGLAPNDGDTKLWDNQAAADAGFSATNRDNPAAKDPITGVVNDSARKWIVSQVNVEPGEIEPGITKSAEKEEYGVEETVKWNVTVYNSGRENIRNYEIRDTVQYPYVFEGDVTYSLFSEDKPSYTSGSYSDGVSTAPYEVLRASGANGDYLFKVGERTTDSDGVTRIKLTSNENTNTDVTLNGGYVSVSSKLKMSSSNHGEVNKFKVAISQNTDAGNVTGETISILFEDFSFVVPNNGRGVMTLVTNRNPALKNTGYYVNNAYFEPKAQEWKEGKVSKGKNVKDASGNNAYVMAEANINTTSESSTSSKTAVTENELTDAKIAESTSKDVDGNKICLTNLSSIFRYTLTVQNSNTSEMTGLVIIDNLPQEGDHSALNSSVLRNSEFTVELAQTPDFEVTVTSTDGTVNKLTLGTDYTIEYSDATGGYTSDDWAGTSTSLWNSTSSGARSFRVVLNNSVTVAKGANVAVSFDAKISNVNEVEPGEIAWNSFGYEYLPENSTTRMYAAPLSVGVEAQSSLYITKELVNSKSESVTADKDYTFKFLVYSGDELSFSAYDEKTIGPNIMSKVYGTDTGCTFMTVTVKQGQSFAENFIDTLNNTVYRCYYDYSTGEIKYYSPDDTGNITWEWQNDTTYHVVEIKPEDASSNAYTYDAADNDNAMQFSFVYNSYDNAYVTAVNRRNDWKIKLSKLGREAIPANEADYVSDGTEPKLKGAVFGLYSPVASEALEKGDISAKLEGFGGQYGLSFDIDRILKDYMTITVGDVTYYLSDLRATDTLTTTDSDGNEVSEDGVLIFDGLYKDTYLVKEIIAPAGYAIENKETYYTFNYTDAVTNADSTANENLTAEKKVYNVTAYDLPTTGGRGLKKIYGLGVLIAAAAVLLLLKRKTNKA